MVFEGRRRKRKDIFEIIKEFEEALEREFEEIFDRFLGHYETKSMWCSDGTLEPLVEVKEEEDRYLITIDLPLANLKTLSIVGKYNIIEIRCQLKRDVKLDKWVIQRQTTFREYRKTIELPEDADVSRFQVRKYENFSIIEIVVPKKFRSLREFR